ncbi:uncharacterized protein LOC124263868 [Haliotis rubra]|uniref:uncharacterized protein LOC124263868 n=1 Tax=Haliotis rubra TaxID=36100 RepID=UPI001EE6353D|nr:uncharacterized protein LOC124263868 [Haliotis rubra]XP_046554545.1 uncharacterized protein LOC124263868 [Haliotis rubra]XP_046554546.1 uncharacterized protein LOC124263868 [Haliotis rubra]
MMEGLETKSIDRNEVLERLTRMKRELVRKEKKLERAKRALRAKAHVKQKLREQALIQGNCGSPHLQQEESQASANSNSWTPTSVANSSLDVSQSFSDEKSENFVIRTKRDLEKHHVRQREITPSSRRPFLAKLEQACGQSLKSEINVQCSKSIDTGLKSKALCKQLVQYESNKRVKATENATSEDVLDCSVQVGVKDRCSGHGGISPDLLEDYPIILDKKVTLCDADDIHLDNSLFLTPAPVSNNSEKVDLHQQCQEHSVLGLTNVKLKLEFGMENALETVGSNGKTNDIQTVDKQSKHVSLESKHESQDDRILDDCILVQRTFSSDVNQETIQSSLSPVSKITRNCKRENALSLSRKRKSGASAQRHNEKKFKSNGMETDSVFVTSETESVSREDTVTVVSDSLSPVASQSLLKPLIPKESQATMKEDLTCDIPKEVLPKEVCDKTFVNNCQNIKENSLSNIFRDNHKMSFSEETDLECKSYQKKKSSKKSPKIKTGSSQQKQTQPTEYLDFTELDVIPFSQFQYSDCLFSSQDLLSETVPGKRGRKSHFGMLIQRRSPRLSAGLKNLVGDDIMPDDSNSETIASEILETDSLCGSQILCPELVSKGGRRLKKSKKGIMISSVFQFIIDEAKRVKEVKEFVLPINIFNKRAQKKLAKYVSQDSVSYNGLTSEIKHNTGMKVDGFQFGRCKNGSNQIRSKHVNQNRRCQENLNNNTVEDAAELLDFSVCKEESKLIKVDMSQSFSAEKIPFKMSQGNIGDESKQCDFMEERDNATCKNVNLLNEMCVFDTAREENQSALSTPKHQCVSFKTPKQEVCDFATPKHHPSLMSTPKVENSFVTPKHQIRRTKYDIASTETCSPSLFPSPEVNEESTPLFCSPVSASKASPSGVAALPEGGDCGVDDDDVFSSLADPADTEVENREEKRLVNVGCFQTSKTEPIISVLCGVLHTAGSLVDFVVTVFSTSLSIWSMETSLWTNELDWILPEGCEAETAWLMPSEDKIVVVLSGSSIKVPVMVSVFVYDWLSGDSTRFNLPLPASVRCPMSNGICCPLTDRQITVFYRQGTLTRGQKLTLNATFTATVDDINLDSIDGHLTSVISVQDLSPAIVGLTVNSLFHIWNHECGLLLQTVDISFSCSTAVTLASVQSEQGYLLLTMMNTKGDKPASLLAVNPMTCESHQIFSYETVPQWKGSGMSELFEDLLVVCDKSGSLLLFDICSGQLMVRLSDLHTKCLAVDPSQERIFSGQKDGCVHVYQLS